MELSQKQIKYIQKQYPGKTAEQLAGELNTSSARIYQALGLRRELWSQRLDSLIGYLFCSLIVVAPFVFIDGVNEFADLPQRVFIQAVMTCLAILWMLKAMASGELRLSRNPAFLMMLGFAAWALLSFFWSVYGYDAFYVASHWMACTFGLVAIVTVLHREPWPGRICWAICIAGAGVALLGLCQQYFKVKWVPVVVSPAAVFANANMAADYVSIAVPIILALGLQRWKSVPGLAACAVGILLVLFVYHTHARAAYLGVAAALGWAGLLLLKQRLRKPRALRVAGLAVALVMLAAASALLFPAIRRPLILRAGTSAQYRWIVWSNSVHMVKDSPVLGIGAGNFRISYGGYSAKAVPDKAFTKDKQIRKTHNEYVQNAVELGLPGLVLFVAPLFYGLVMAWRLVPYGIKQPEGLLVAGFSGGLIAYAVTSFFSFPLQRSMPMLMVVVCVGLLIVYYGRQRPTQALQVLRAPRAVMICLLIAAAVAGAALARYNVRNILCDRYFQTVLAMERRKNGEVALRAARAAHAYNRDRLDVLTALGRANLTNGNPEEAIRNFEEVRKKWPHNLNAMILCGIAYANTGQSDKAVDILGQVLRIQPETKEARNIIATIKSRGSAYVKLD